jgi:S-methylmethionine-dependent homocysteine/selenocysteine methylase
MGVTIEQAAKGLAEAGADLIGSNCGNGIEAMIEIAKEFRKYTTLPLVFQSNAGVPQMKEGRPAYSEGPEFMAQRVPELASAGASIIGGCCGTTPEHIRAIRKVVDSLNRARQVYKRKEERTRKGRAQARPFLFFVSVNPVKPFPLRRSVPARRA